MSLRLQATRADRGLDVSLEVASGETLALLGPNGAGKSTVLAVVAGLLLPDRGRVTLDDRVLTSRGLDGHDVHVAPHQRQVGLLSQEAALFPHLSVRDNVAFGPRSRGASRADAVRVADGWLEEVGLHGLAERRPGQLSGGQAQRAAVARALAADPRLLLLDEPLAALDVAVTPALRQTLRRVLARRTAVVVTHDVLDALLLADRVVVLDDGMVVEEGACADVLSKPRSPFTARIAGLNLVRGTWRDGAVEAAAGLRIVGEALDGVPAVGAPAVAVFPPTAVSVFLTAPGGSPRNALEVMVTDVEPHGGHVRVRAAELSADVTPRAVADLDLVPGARVSFVVKATEVAVYAI
ncbi:MAG: ATP-binding cassette domain-containing protein [Nocardioidaceae bacterium]